MAPGVAAFCAAEEPDFTLVSSSQLAEPPEREIVLALRALDLDRGHGLDLTFFLHDDDLVVAALKRARHLLGFPDFPDITALPALQLAPG